METDLVKFDEVTAAIAKYKVENAALVFNYEDAQGNKDARSHCASLRSVKGAIAKIHKEVKADALAYGRACDKKKNDLTAEVDEMHEFHYKYIREIEERVQKEAEAKAEAACLEAERVEAEKAAELNRREQAAADLEAANRAEAARLQLEKDKLEAAKQAEIDKAFAVKQAQEQASRERHLVAEAAEQDKKDALHQAERDKEDALHQAERDKEDALHQAEREKQAAIEAEQAKAKRKAEIEEAGRKIAAIEAAATKKREADIEAKRVADTEHRAAVEQAVYDRLLYLIQDQTIAHTVTTEINNGTVPHVTINY